jgi:hypothetical protein
MANPEHLEILKQGVEQWNKWREEHPGLLPDLSEANLMGGDFIEANLAGADLSGANLSMVGLYLANLRGTNLGQASLVRVDLSRADLRGANLARAELSGSNLSDVDLRGADLQQTGLFRVDLRGAKLDAAKLCRADLSAANISGAELGTVEFTHSIVWGTHFSNVDLSVAKGLETVVHGGPSSVGIDTIYKSHGKIPEVFLRGCGVPDELIDFIRSMVGRPIEFYSCFISYSTKDQEFAERLHTDLQAKGVRCWFAPHDIKGGGKLHEQIDEAIRLHDRLLLILSKDSMNSEWVKTEIAKARKREVKEGKRVLFPVRLVEFDVLRDWECFDGDTGKDSAREIREYFIPDFSKWKDHDSYQTAFQRLVSDLKAEASK